MGCTAVGADGAFRNTFGGNFDPNDSGDSMPAFYFSIKARFDRAIEYRNEQGVLLCTQKCIILFKQLVEETAFPSPAKRAVAWNESSLQDALPPLRISALPSSASLHDINACILYDAWAHDMNGGILSSDQSYGQTSTNGN